MNVTKLYCLNLWVTSYTAFEKHQFFLTTHVYINAPYLRKFFLKTMLDNLSGITVEATTKSYDKGSSAFSGITSVTHKEI